MTEQELQAIKERLANIPKGWTISEGTQIIEGLKVSADYLIAEVEFLHAQRDSQAKIIEDLRQALKTIAHTPKFKLLCEVENYAELVLEGRESEWVEVPFDSELKILREAIERKNEVHDALNRDYVKVRDENKQLKNENAWLKTNMKNIATDKNWRIAPIALAGESNV